MLTPALPPQIPNQETIIVLSFPTPEIILPNAIQPNIPNPHMSTPQTHIRHTRGGLVLDKSTPTSYVLK